MPTWNVRETWVLLWALVFGAACEVAPTAEQGGAQALVCGDQIADILLDLGAGPNVVAADTASRSRVGLAATADLGKRCRDVNVIAKTLPIDIALLGEAESKLASGLELQGIQVIVLAPTSLEGVFGMYRDLGLLFAADSRARILNATIIRGISAIAVKRDGRTRLKVAWLLNPVGDAGDWEVAGGVGILHELLELAGAENAFHVPLTARHRVSGRELASAAAQLLLVSTEAQTVPDSALVAELRLVPAALSQDTIFDPLERVEALHAILYPDDHSIGESPATSPKEQGSKKH